MAEQKPAAKADFVEQFRQHLAGLDMHVIERTWQRCWRRGAIAGARIDEHAGRGGGLQLFRKIAPSSSTAAFMQHHDNRRVGRRADHAVFEMRGADGEEA
jgi:hypothetical protein